MILPLVCTHVAAVHFLMSKNGNKITFAYGYAITLIKVILTVAPFLKTGPLCISCFACSLSMLTQDCLDFCCVATVMNHANVLSYISLCVLHRLQVLMQNCLV